MKEKITKKEMNELKDDSWLYIILLSTLLILSASLKYYTFNLKTEMTLSIFIIPLIFFVTNYITKKHGFKKGLLGIIISTFNLLIFTVIINFSLGGNITLGEISGEVLGFIVGQIINLMIYTFLLKNTSSPRILVFLTYLFSIIVLYLVYTIVQVNIIILDDFWTGYFITLAIQSLECILLTIFDSKIKIGI